jgi:hypothetical protein
MPESRLGGILAIKTAIRNENMEVGIEQPEEVSEGLDGDNGTGTMRHYLTIESYSISCSRMTG